MATVASVTGNPPLGYPSAASIARHRDLGDLYVFGRVDGSNNYRLWKTNAAASSWSTVATFNRANLIEWSSIVVDRAQQVHVAYRVSTVFADALYYRKYSIPDGTWSAELLISSNDNGGTLGSFWQGIDIAAVRHSNGSYAICTISTNTVGTSKHGIWAHGISITEAGKIYLNNPIINGQRSWFVNGPSPGRTTPSIDIEHNGDGVLSSTPALWVTWGRGKLYCIKLSWLGTLRGWNGPSSIQTLDGSTAAMDYVPGRWDGARWMMAVPDDLTPSTVMVYERNQANNFTTFRQTPVHPTGAIRSVALSYDFATKDIRVYAVGTSTAVPYYVDFVRATGIWGAWTLVVADAVSFTPPDEFSTRRGGTHGSARHDVLYATNAASPYDLKHIQQAPAYAPSTPTWDTSATPYINGGAADVAAGLLLDWNFVDQDPNDAQGSYALRRQIGAGAFAWWRTSDSTWQAVETFNTSGTSAVTLPAAWGADADANHQYWVRTRDSTATPSASYSDPMVIVPSAKVNPSFSTPAAAAVLTTASVAISWTVAQQTQYRVRLVSGATVGYDSGWVTSTATSLTPDFALPDASAWTIELTTKNAEGLASTTQTRSFTVDYIETPVPLVVPTADTVNGWISVAITNPAPTGSQPVLASVDLYRRPALTSNVVTNGEMAGNVTGWIGVGGTLSYSTTQFAPGSGPGSARLVPNASATAQVSAGAAARGPAVAGRRYTASGMIRPDTTNKQMQMLIAFYDAGGTIIGSATAVTYTTHNAAVWYLLSVSAEAPAGTVTAGPIIGLTGTPAAGDAFYADRLQLREFDPAVGTPVAAGLTAGATVRDWRAGARTAYEYQAIAYGANGAVQPSGWTP